MDRNSFDPSPIAEVDGLPERDRWTLVFVRDLKHPPEKVWAALTEPGQLAEWAPFTADRDLGAAGAATLTMIDGGASEGMPAVVRRAERPTLLEYLWGDDLLRWELASTGPGTRLTLRHTIQDRDSLSKMAAGWHLCLDVAERLLDGNPIGAIRGQEAMDFGWEKLRDAYDEKLSPGDGE